jgi:hypothetical protein
MIKRLRQEVSYHDMLSQGFHDVLYQGFHDVLYQGFHAVLYQGFHDVFYQSFHDVLNQEAKYVESWPNTTFAWAGWTRFGIPVDTVGLMGYIPCYGAPVVHCRLLPVTRLAGRKILIEQNITSRQAQHSVYYHNFRSS